MYVEQPWDLTDRLEALRAAASTVDLTRGHASYISPPGETTAVFRDLLSDRFPTGIARLVILQPSQQLVGHRDPPIPAVRYHIPLVTNIDCWVHHDGVWQQLAAGHVYQMDPSQWHGAVNWGSTPRLHLMLDTPYAATAA